MTALSLIARKACQTGMRDAIDSGGGAMLFYTGTPPAAPDLATTETLLAQLPLASPCGAISASGGLALLTLTVPLSSDALASGLIGWVRIVNGDGEGFLDLLAGLPLPEGSPDTPAPVLLNALQVYAGGEVQLLSCVLAR